MPALVSKCRRQKWLDASVSNIKKTPLEFHSHSPDSTSFKNASLSYILRILRVVNVVMGSLCAVVGE